MKKLSKNSRYAFLLVAMLCFFGCEKDELGYVETNVHPLIYIAGAVDGKITIKPENKNVTVDKQAKTVTVALGINRSGIQEKSGYTVNISNSTTGLPSNVIGISSSDYSIYTSETSQAASKIEVPVGQTSGSFYVKFSKAILDANAGKQIGFKVSLSNPSQYTLNEVLSVATVVIDVPSFEEHAVDVTSRYVKNPGSPFIRSDKTSNTRFGLLEDWTVNAAVKNMENFTKGGFDSYNGGGYMSMERWGSPAIPNGKIYQTVTLPKGKYQFQADFQWAGISNQAFFAVSEGNTLPNVEDISTAIASSSYSAPRVSFQLADQKEVSIGIVANLINDFQGFRIRGVSLLKYESPFND